MAKKELIDWIDGTISVLNTLYTRDDFYDAVAASTKKQFDALVRAGFSEDQATRIVSGMSSKSDGGTK
jgi:SOS response regulatory protein OraA/RecX